MRAKQPGCPKTLSGSISLCIPARGSVGQPRGPPTRNLGSLHSIGTVPQGSGEPRAASQVLGGEDKGMGGGSESRTRLATARPRPQPALATANLRRARPPETAKPGSGPRPCVPATERLQRFKTGHDGVKATRPGTLGPNLRLSKKRERKKFLKPSMLDKGVFFSCTVSSSYMTGCTARLALAAPCNRTWELSQSSHCSKLHSALAASLATQHLA